MNLLPDEQSLQVSGAGPKHEIEKVLFDFALQAVLGDGTLAERIAEKVMDYLIDQGYLDV